MSRQEGGSTLVMPPSTSNKPFLFRRKTWSRTPKRSFFSFLMCFNLLKRKQQQRPREKEPSPTASTTTSTISSVVVPIEFTEKETALVEQPETSQQEPILGQEVEQQEQQEEAVNYLLDPIKKQHQGRKCLVLDLDETLIHSSFKTVSEADFIVPVEIDGHYHNVFVLKRPGVDDFMKKMGELYEIVVFTASLSKYADPVLDKFDLHNVIHHRLFRESCHSYKGTYIKDLSRLGRDLKHVIILDNTPTSYSFHPSNAVPVSTWFNDQHDSELIDLIPFLEDLSRVEDVVDVLNITI